MNFVEQINELIQAGIKSKSLLLQNYRNIKSDFKYLKSNNPKLSDLDIILKLKKERQDAGNEYERLGKKLLAVNEFNEVGILNNFLPEEPSEEEIITFLEGLTDIEKSKKNFKKFQEKCENQFGMKVDSKIILQFLGT